jgi:hypothetical protein
LRRTLLACLLLLGVYAAASALLDPGGYLGTDTGAKVATLDRMVDTGTWRPALPYWADAQDPDGRVHPIYDTAKIDGHWVHVTTLPMLFAARPLYDLGGYRLTLVLPMLGAIGAALAARSLARRVRDERSGWWAYWLVGLGSPITIYALDLWEHSLGTACMVGAVALLAGVVDGEPWRSRAAGAGLLLGAAATMRTEAFVYSAVAVGVCGLLLLLERKVRPAIEVGVAAVAGFAVPWFANQLLESSVGGLDRAGRATGAAQGGLRDLGDRAHEAVIGLFASKASDQADSLVLGLLLAGLVAGAVWLATHDQTDRARLAVAAAVVLAVLRMAGGLGFVPGLLVAAPVAAAALAVRPQRGAHTYLLVVALGALPLVWAFQYLGGALPQWGDRYALPTCTVLVALGAAALPPLDRVVRAGVVALAVLVTASGVAWMHERSHGVDRWFEEATARPEDVLIARNGFFVREGGAASADHRWLTAVSDADLRYAVGVVAEAGLHTFAVVDEDPAAPARLAGAALQGTDATDLLGARLYLHSYRL